MEVPWWAIVSVFFILCNDTNIYSKAEASIIPPYTKLRQDIENDSEIKQTYPSAKAQDTLRSPFTSNSYPGLSIRQKQLSAVQANASQQEGQAIVSSILATANQQRSLASNAPPKLNRSVFPIMVTSNHPQLQDSIVQQKSSVTSSSTATKLENPLVQTNSLQQQSKVSSASTTNQNLLRSRYSLDSAELAKLSTSNHVSFQEAVPQQQIYSKLTSNLLKSISPGSLVHPDPLYCEIHQVAPQNQLKQISSHSEISSSDSQREASASSSVKRLNSMKRQNIPILPNVGSLPKASEQSNAVLSSSQNLRTQLTDNNVLSKVNYNSILSSTTQPLIQGNTPHQSNSFASTATPEIIAQRIPNPKSPGFTIAYKPVSNEASLQENVSQHQSFTKITSSQNTPFTTITEETLPANIKVSSVSFEGFQANPLGTLQEKTSTTNALTASIGSFSPQFAKLERPIKFNFMQCSTPTFPIKQEQKSQHEPINVQADASSSLSEGQQSQLKSLIRNSFNSNTVPNIPQQTWDTQNSINKQSSVTSIKPSYIIDGPWGFFDFPVTSTNPNPSFFPPVPSNMPWPQGLTYQGQAQDFPSLELPKIPPVQLIPQTSSSQFDTAVPFSLLNTQETMIPQFNQISTQSNTVSSNLLASPINAQQIVKKTQQQISTNPVTSNAYIISPILPNTVVSNNVELNSNIHTTRPEIRSIFGMQSGRPEGVSRSFPSSNCLNSNIGYIQTISPESNSVASDFLSTGNTTPLGSTPYSSNAISACAGNVAINSYNDPKIINPLLENFQYPVISQSAMLPSYSSLSIQPVSFSKVNSLLSNLPVSNFDTNCVKESETTDILPTQQSSLNTVKISTEYSQGSYQPEVNSVYSIAPQSLSSESEIIPSNPVTSYSSQTSIQSDISTPVAPINTIQSRPQFDELIPKSSLGPVENLVDIHSSVHATQEISSGPLTTKPCASIGSTISTTKETVVESLDSGDSTACVSLNVNNVPVEFATPTITSVASIPTIPASLTPLCSVMPSPPVFPSFSYPPIQPIIMEDSNSRTNNWLPVILASLIRDNCCLDFGGNYCNGPCNCGSQYRPFSYQTPINNNLNTCCSRKGSTCNCATRGQSNSVIIIEIDSDETDTEDTSESSSGEQESNP